ncbi:MAG TPA: VCBS repeat-containing protein [candidate division Zixibacteria bacterium]|nr:VCBS repeat-containing protein [candidate division Zixibacteria bacterium]
MLKIDTKSSFERMKSKIILASLLILVGFALLPRLNQNVNFGQAHSPLASPKEIFSLWNDTAPSIDGAIDFTYTDLSGEWSSAGVYNLYLGSDSPNSKLIIQNDNNNLYVALDATDFTTQDPGTDWGCAIYLDRDHNGILTDYDHAVFFFGNDSGDTFYYRQFSSSQNKWITLGSHTLGNPISTYNVVLDTSFGDSYFEVAYHRQYEVLIPLSQNTIQTNPGNITGIAFEVFDDFTSLGRTWPGFDGTANEYRTFANGWGDLCLGKEDDFIDYIFEENTNIMKGIFGENNGTFLGTADIDGNGDLELIVSSNSTVAGKENLTAIYDWDVSNGNITRIWSSWESIHKNKMMLVRDIEAYDFDENGKDEIYLCGNNESIIRLSSWNGNDFDSLSYINPLDKPLRGYIEIGDVDNDAEIEIIVSYDDGANSQIFEIAYDNSTGIFSLERIITPTNPASTKVHTIEVANMDSDIQNEILFFSQITSDDSISKTELEIMQWSFSDYDDNGQDDLTSGTASSTYDNFGHTIIVEDVDNDAEIEIILVGKNYLRIFGANDFGDTAPPLELIINDNTSTPFMGGGAVVGDFDGDGVNELIVGCNNGTLLILNITDAGSNSLSYKVEWSSDVGHSPGYKESLIIYDIDQDGENETLLGDNFGQIISLGRSEAPTLSITFPTLNHVYSTNIVSFTWDASDDYSMHHYDILTNDTLRARINGTLGGISLNLAEGYHNLEIIGFDVTGKSSSDTTSFRIDLGAPEVTITSPANYYQTKEDKVTIQYSYSDLDGNLDHFEIYRNGTPINTNIANTMLSYDVPLESDGLWNITIVAVDEDFYQGIDSVFVIQDDTPPTISITSHSDNSAVNTSTIDLEWSASDFGVGLDFFRVYRDGILNATVSSSINSQIAYLEFDQEYLFEVRAFDNLGNWWSDSVSITRDTIKPVVNITSPLTGLLTTNQILNVQWTNNDNLAGTGIDYSTIIVNGEIKYSGTANQADINLGTDGSKEIIVSSFDKAGNVAQDYILVILETLNPYIEIISPVNRYNTSLDQVTVYWNSSDLGTGIAYYEVYLETSLIETIIDPYVTYATITLVHDVANNISVYAYDNYDRVSFDSIVVIHNSSLGTIEITSPIPLTYYTNDVYVTFSWVVSDNLVDNITRFEIYINGILNQTINDNTTRSVIVHLGSIPIDSFPTLNVTIVAITINPVGAYKDFRWIKVDQSAPIIAISSPTNNTIISTRVVKVSWDITEEGSLISKYIVKINGTLINIWNETKDYQYFEFDETTSLVTISIEIFDLANNQGNTNVTLIIALVYSNFSIDLVMPFYTKTGSLNFNLTVIEAGSGIKKISIYIDNSEVLTQDYQLNIQYNPFTTEISILNTDYQDDTGSHSLIIVLYDYYCRESRQDYSFVVDKIAPAIVGTTTLGSTALDHNSNTPAEFTIDQENGSENYTLSASISDNIGIKNVTVTIISDGNIEIHIMTPDALGTLTSGRYSVDLELSEMELGDYSLRIEVTDFAGNTYNLSYEITLRETEVLPWILRGNNLIYVSAGGASALVLIVVMSIVMPRTVANIGWKREIVVIAYILNGIPCVYMVNKPEMVKDELLFGGAMTGIRAVLQEITGEKAKLEIQSVEVGQKKVLICPGIYGDTVLMVNNVKPIYKNKLIKFTENFETYYGDLLKDNPIITPDTFRGASILVESHFGIVEQMQLVDECEFEELDLSTPAPVQEQYPTQPIYTEQQPAEVYQEPIQDSLVESVSEFTAPVEIKEPPKVRIEEVVNELSTINQSIFLEIIQLSQNAITNLLEKNIVAASLNNAQILELLEVLLKSQTLPDITHGVMRALLNITQDLHAAIEAGKSNDDIAYKKAVEKVSASWLKEIGDNW